MELRRAGLHRLLHVDDEGQLFILHLQRAHALVRRDLVLRDDHGNVVAPIADVAVQQPPVGDVLMPRIHRPRVAGGGEVDLRHVEAGQHLHDTGDGGSRRGVHMLDVAVGDLRVLDADVERARGHAILVVFGPPARLVKGVDADLAPAYLVHGGCPPPSHKSGLTCSYCICKIECG